MPITVTNVTIYDQAIGAGTGTARLRCVATLVTDPGAGQVGSLTLDYQVVTVVGPPAQVVSIGREDWLAIRAMRALP